MRGVLFWNLQLEISTYSVNAPTLANSAIYTYGEGLMIIIILGFVLVTCVTSRWTLGLVVHHLRSLCSRFPLEADLLASSWEVALGVLKARFRMPC